MHHKTFPVTERLTVRASVQKGGSIIEQTPFFFSQTQKSRKTSFCCTACGRYLGDTDAQLFRAQGNSELASEFVTRITQRSEENSVTMCPRRGCKHGYCNAECQRNDECLNGHWLNCIGGGKGNTNLTREFTRHAFKTNDLFVAGSTVIAKLISNAAPLALISLTSRDPPQATLITAVHETVRGILESALVDFENQFPCLRPFWHSSCSSSSSKCSNDSSAAGGFDDSRDISCRMEVGGQPSSVCDGIDVDEVSDALDVSDVLVQQAHESWSLLLLLLRHEKTGPSYHDNELRGVSADFSISRVRDIHADSAVLEETRQLPSVSDNYAVIVRIFADLLTFPRWLRMLGSLSCHLVPLQIDHPLIQIAKDLPKVPQFKNRKNILEALASFLCPSSTHSVDAGLKTGGEISIDKSNGDGCDRDSHSAHEGGDFDRDKVGNKRKTILEIQINSKSHKTCSPANDNGCGDRAIVKTDEQRGKDVEKEKEEEDVKMAEVVNAMDTERRIVRLAQAAAIMPSSSSSSSSSSYSSFKTDIEADLKENQSVIGSRSLPTENPFSSICFFAMALVPHIAVNAGCLDQAAVDLARITAQYGGPLKRPASVGHQEVTPNFSSLSSSLSSIEENEDVNVGNDGRGVTGRKRISGSVAGKENACHPEAAAIATTDTSNTNKVENKVEKKVEVREEGISSQSRCKYVTHSCVPNCRLQAFMSPSTVALSTRLVALRDVKKGDFVLCSAVETSQVRHDSFKCTHVETCISFSSLHLILLSRFMAFE